jgi:hypothetical protein
MNRMTISQLAPHQLGDVSRLCEQELALDRWAGSIPRIVTREPHRGLVAVRDSLTVGVCIGSIVEADDGRCARHNRPGILVVLEGSFRRRPRPGLAGQDRPDLTGQESDCRRDHVGCFGDRAPVGVDP